MRLHQFKRLDKEEQGNTLWDKGVLLGIRREGEYKVLLYGIDGFYVEVFYCQKTSQVVELKSFLTTDMLTPYLDKINLQDVFKLICVKK
ncbi:MAG TPA: hypothetical protein VM888_04300 [Chitinophagaceae bacterium]|jgi:hypothetical protein|nr:hypothetical protein [Chitinophagaceae bacterium]